MFPQVHITIPPEDVLDRKGSLNILPTDFLTAMLHPWAGHHFKRGSLQVREDLNDVGYLFDVGIGNSRDILRIGVRAKHRPYQRFVQLVRAFVSRAMDDGSTSSLCNL